MKIICYYNKNLKMSEGKLAAQVGHVCKSIGFTEGFNFDYPDDCKEEDDIIVVLGLRENKFKEKLKEYEDKNSTHIQEDLGYTEVEKGTITCFGYIEN